MTAHALSFHAVTIVPAAAMLENLTAILAKAKSYCEARGSKESDLLNDRIAFDQFPLVRQVQIVGENAVTLASNLSGAAAPSFERTETTIDELTARLDAALAFLRSISPDQIDGKEDARIPMPYREGKEIVASDYATRYLLPNFYFHATVAYEILRKNGLVIGKGDYLGSLPLVDAS